MSGPVFPPPDATYAEIQAWYEANKPPPEPAHEAPAVSNGPSLVCNACGVVRVPLFKPFCNACMALIGASK